MPLTRAAPQVRPQSGNVSQVLIAEQSNYADEGQVDASSPRVVAANGALSGGDFYKFQPRINSADIAREGTTIENTFLDGSAAQSQDAPGRSNIANGMSIALSGNGTALPLRMLTQDKNPTWNIFGGTGQNLPGAVNVVANTARLADTAADASIADNLSSTANPVRLTVTISASASITGTRAAIIIEGTDNADNAISETIGFVSVTTRTATSRLWYKTVTKVSTQGWDNASGKTFGITAQDRSAQVIFTPQDRELVAFWTAEVAKGAVPNLYYGLSMDSATMDITDDALVAFDCTFLGRRARLYRNLAGTTAPPSDITKWATDASGLETASADVFAGWQGILTAENADLQVAMQELTFTLNQELEYTNVLGSEFQSTAPARSGKRLTQLEATVIYDPNNNYSTYFEGNQVIPNVKLQFRQSGLGAYPYLLSFELEECQLTADPDPAVDDAGTITQTVTMKGVRGRRNIEYLVRARYSEYDRVRIYT